MLNTYAPQGQSSGIAALPGLPTRLTPVGVTVPSIGWVRNPDWLPMPNVANTEKKFVALNAIFSDSNFLAVNCAGSAGYSVFWGDSNVSCTFTDSGDLVGAVAHGLVNGDIVMFNEITTTTGISVNTNYYVVNKNTDDFQVSLTSGGSAIALTTNGTGYINIPEKVATGVQANHQYTYSAIDTGLLTTGLVSFTDSGDLVTRVAHGRKDGDVVMFRSITSTTGISINVNYYVINSTPDTYQLSTTVGGSAVTLTTDGTGSTLDHKQVFVTIIAQGTGTLSTVNTSVKHTQTLLSTYCTGFLDIYVTGNQISTLTFSAFNGIRHDNCERVRIGLTAVGGLGSTFGNGFKKLSRFEIDDSSTVTDFSGMFSGCTSLVSVSPFSTSAGTGAAFQSMFSDCSSLVSIHKLDTSKGTTFTGMFSGCSALQSVPELNTTLGTSFTSMFNGCSSLKTVPMMDTKNSTSFSNMFLNCSSLVSVPPIDTALGTVFTSMFQNCAALTTIPAINTAAGQGFSSMFSGCSSLISIPLLNTAAGTDLSSMFTNCKSLLIIPLLVTTLNTNFTSMFNGCLSLTSIPPLDTVAGTNFTSMFRSCTSLSTIPMLNTAAGVTFTSMFQASTSIRTIPLINTGSGVTLSNMFNGCTSLNALPLLNFGSATTAATVFSTCTNLSVGALSGNKVTTTYSGCKMSVTECNSVLDNLGIGSSTTITLTNNWGSQAAISTTSVTTVSGTAVVTMGSTTGLVVGMEATGTGIAGTARAVTMTDAGDLVNLTAHGIPNGTKMSFSTIVTTTGIAIKTIYYVVNANVNDFQVSLTPGGSAITLTTDGSGTITYPNTILSIVPNTSVTLNVPCSASGTVTMTSTTIRRSSGTMKGWTVTT